MIGITLVEDVAVVVLTILMPALVSLSPSHFARVGKALGLAALILVRVAVLARFLVPPMLARVARAQ
jgi:CPA2 family monovalent cation:H+ antiporter-2